MKTFPTVFLGIFLALWHSTIAWSAIPQTRQEVLQGLVTTVGAATFSTLATPSPANAVDASIFNHQYSDPKHPNCRRIISAKQDGTATVSGTDGNPACPEDGSGTVWRLPGEVDGKTILVDFSAKGGPANLKGTWDGTGIKWPDGNKWTVKE